MRQNRPASFDEILDMTKEMPMRLCWSLCLTATLLAANTNAQAQALDKVVFATNWKAQAAHGGFYQALADGTYKKYGLDVTIQPGGPQVNNRPLLPAGRIDFLMTGNLLHSFDNVKNKVPTVAFECIVSPTGKCLYVSQAHPGTRSDKTIVKTNVFVTPSSAGTS
jgi:NitT/TauT family transport system substrate-binding protein